MPRGGWGRIPFRKGCIYGTVLVDVEAGRAAGARSPQEVRDTVEQLRRPIPQALWDELRAAGLLDVDTPVPPATSTGHAAPVGEAAPPKEPS